MPELPDVETFRRYLDATSLHQTIEAAEVESTRMVTGASARALTRHLEGSRFESTARHGKFLFVALRPGPWLVLHFGMTGRLAYFKDSGKPPAHAHLLVHFSNGYHLAGIWERMLGRIALADSPASFAREAGLGPDAYEPGPGLGEFKRMFHDRRGAAKSALMDQSFLAGIGNVYSDEMLFQARIHPRAEARRLDGRRLARLHRAMRHVLRLAIARQADPDRLPDSWLLPRRGRGERCPRCGWPIERLKSSGRTCYLCPRCQPKAA